MSGSSVLGMPPFAFIVVVLVAIGLLMIYTPRGTTTDKSKMIMCFIAVLFVAVLLWPMGLGHWMDGLLAVASGTK